MYYARETQFDATTRIWAALTKAQLEYIVNKEKDGNRGKIVSAWSGGVLLRRQDLNFQVKDKKFSII